MTTKQWIRTEKRQRIYERDGYECVWCGSGVSGFSDSSVPNCASLDHVVPRDAGGSNHHSNLVTACHSCNSRRQHKSAIEFAFSEAHRAPPPERDSSAEFLNALVDARARATLERVIAAMGTELPK